MKSNKIFFAVSALALLSTVTLAQAGTASLAPAGQGPIDEAPARTSQISREQMRAQVTQARYAGLLIPAGQGVVGNRPSVASVLTRAEVKHDVLQARADGTLVPAGEGPIDSTIVAQHGRGAGTFAFGRRNGPATRTN